LRQLPFLRGPPCKRKPVYFWPPPVTTENGTPGKSRSATWQTRKKGSVYNAVTRKPAKLLRTACGKSDKPMGPTWRAFGREPPGTNRK